MDIESKIKREGGTIVDMGTAKYHFAPREDGAHVANVQDEAHADRFLSITEGYRLYRGTAAAPEQNAEQEGEQIILLGSDDHPASFTIHDKTYSLGDIVARAQKDSGLDAAEWNALAAESRAGMIDDVLDEIQAEGEQPADDDAVRAVLVAEYEAKFGKKPHHKVSNDSIRAKLAEG